MLRRYKKVRDTSITISAPAARHRSALATLLLIFTTTASIQTGYADTSRALTTSEQSGATSRALGDLGIQAPAAASTSNRRALSRSASTARHELLLVERRPAGKQDSRRLADIYVYDYRDNRLLHRVVDTATNEVVHRATFTGQQLPLTRSENDRAISILAADADALEFLNKEYARVAGGGAFNFDNVDYKAAVYIASDNVQGVTAQCGQTRCAEILIYTADDKIALDLRPVVDMSTGEVLSVETIHWGLH